MGVNKVEYGGKVLIDLTGDTVTEDTLTKGITAHNAKGEPITGTHVCSGGSTPKLIEKTITENGTYNAADEGADGYSAVTVDIDSTGGSSDNNCEAYHITGVSDVIPFKGNGTVKVWGYGASRSTYTTTVYAFVGDGYYRSASYGTPTKTATTFSVGSDGTLSGLPSGLTSVDLIVEIGV